MLEIDMQGKKLKLDSLLKYGFVQDGEGYVYTCDIYEIKMTATVKVCENKMYTKLTDSLSGEEYVLHGVPSATGSFVGTVRECYQRLVDDVLKFCYEKDVTYDNQTMKVISHIKNRYCHDPEYPWEDDNAIWRRSDNGKWYAAMLTVSRSTLGLQGEGRAEVINLKASPERVQQFLLLDGILPAYHMNKKHWYTVVLDGRVSDAELYALIDESYVAVGKKKN